jgi:hypothetical protein
MANVLVTADIHIHDYRSHNLFDDPQFRLRQFNKLAERILGVAAHNKSEALIIAGDFLHVANPRPYIVNAAFDFLDKVTQELDVYLTSGQHDTDSRTVISGQHTLLTLCDRVPRVHYLHKEQVEIDKTSFYFLGWEPEWTKEMKHMPQSDVLIGHTSPDNVLVGQRGLRMYGGSEIPHEDAPFQIAFLGDCHYHQARRNWVVPGVPIQHSFSDHPNVGIISLDTDTLEWKHVPTIIPRSWEFLQLLITDEQIKNPYVVTRPKVSSTISRIKKEVEGSIDTLAVIEAAVEHSNLEDVNAEIMSGIPKEVRSEVCLDFALDRLKVSNFRSIESFMWENVDSGVKLVSGLNGTGKSSLVSAIMFGLAGIGDARKLVRFGSKNMEVELSVRYGGLRHTIRRGWQAGGGKLQYLINDEKQPSENQKVLRAKIEENLPFLSMVDLFYHQQDRPGFLASYNYSARVDLVSRVLGLKIVNALHQAAQLLSANVERDLTSLREKIASAAAVVEQESLVDFTPMEMIDGAKEENLKGLKLCIQTALGEERAAFSRATAAQSNLANNIKRGTTSLATLEKQRSSIAGRRCYTCGQRIQEQEVVSLLASLDEQIEETTREIEGWQNQFAELDAIPSDLIGKLENKLEQVLGHLGELTALKDQIENLQKLRSSIDTAKQNLRALRQEEKKLHERREALISYKRLMEPNGPILCSLLINVSEILSSDVVRVRAHKQLVSGELRPDFGVDMLVKGKWVPYDELSGGQKTLADLTILEKLVRIAGGIGMIIFDETFRYLDNENLEVAVDLVKAMQCHSTFIVSHTEGFPYWDLAIQSRLDTLGKTLYALR